MLSGIAIIVFDVSTTVFTVIVVEMAVVLMPIFVLEVAVGIASLALGRWRWQCTAVCLTASLWAWNPGFGGPHGMLRRRRSSMLWSPDAYTYPEYKG